MATLGPTLRAAGSTLIAILSPIGLREAVRYLDEHDGVEADLLLCALQVAFGVAFALMVKGRGGDKGTNFMMCKWDNYGAAFDNVTGLNADRAAYNEAILLNATNATAAEVIVEESWPRFPSWREPAIVLIPAMMFMLLWVGDRLSITKKKSDSDNLAAVTPVLDGTSPAPPPRSEVADSLTFYGFFGLSGAFVAVALFGIGALAMYLGNEVENSPEINYRVHQAMCLYLIGLLSIFYWFSFVMSWRTLVNNLADVHNKTVDPLAALDKIPAAKNLMKWYHDNLAIHTAGRYSILLVIAAEVFEFLVQTTNANNLAKFLDWRILEIYGNVIFANFLVFGFCLLTPDRYIPSSAFITIDVLIDATYIMFNIFFVSQPASYWAIIIPLWFQVDMVNDSFTRQAQEQVNKIMIKEAEKRDFDEAKASGTLPETLCSHFMAQLKSGEERGRDKTEPPPGYSELKPRMWYEDSEDSNIATVILEFILPGVAPGQAFTFSQRYTTEERGSGTNETMQTFSKNHRTIHGKPARTAVNAVVYELMDAESKNMALLFDGNPCAEEVDWSGLSVDRLPARMVGEGYHNGNFSSSLKVLKMGRNMFDEGVFGELVAANFTNIEELDVSWNALGGLPEDEAGGLALKRMDVSGNERVSVIDLIAAPADLEMLNASFCGVNEITVGQAVELQDRNMVLHGNPVTRLEWPYEYALTKIPAWLRTLEKVT
ncbi:hypothetical protein TeGR_g7513, partial [Tetraparma gracilis]